MSFMLSLLLFMVGYWLLRQAWDSSDPASSLEFIILTAVGGTSILTGFANLCGWLG
jgi:hypothetical protein